MSNNYAKIYEFKLLKKDELNELSLLKDVIKSFKKNKTVITDNGTFYIKDYKIKKDSIIFLFGKDNSDASNYKRLKLNNDVTKININEKTEILTDFVHFSISRKERLGSYVLFLEKNKLISHYNLNDFLNSFFTTPFSFSLGRRVTVDFYEEIKNAQRILRIKQISKQAKPPLITNGSKMLADIEVIENLELRAKRSKTIPIPYFENFFSKFGNDPKSKIIVDIVDSKGHKMILDFDYDESPYSIKLGIMENNKLDSIQQGIEYELNKYTNLDNEGKLWLIN